MSVKMDPLHVIDQLYEGAKVSDGELKQLIEQTESRVETYLIEKADVVRQIYYGKDVYIRGLIEVSNYCKNNCFYCGIRAGNKSLQRYRLSEQEILSCCEEGHRLGFRTFVLQGGEDPLFTDEIVCRIVSAVKGRFPDCAVTLSLGEKSRESYQRLKDAGADRYLLRHETACAAHYAKLHPETMRLTSRKQCLYTLKEIGYQVGAGFMVDSPYQTTENMVEDLRFLQDLRPAMIGIGPFLPHKETPFGAFEKGDLHKCLRVIAIARLLFPYALIPATTAMGTLHPKGRELGLKAGANVVMPNLSPVASRKLYALYNDKIATGEEAAEGKARLERRVREAGYCLAVARGDVAQKKR